MRTIVGFVGIAPIVAAREISKGRAPVDAATFGRALLATLVIIGFCLLIGWLFREVTKGDLDL